MDYSLAARLTYKSQMFSNVPAMNISSLILKTIYINTPEKKI